MRLLSFLLLASTAMARVPPTGWVNIVSLNSGKCLDMVGGPAATSPGVLTQQWTCSQTGQTSQIFQFIPVSGGYEIQAMNSGLALGPLNGATANGTSVAQFPYNVSNAYQTWIVNPADTAGYYTLSPATDPNSCLDVSNVSRSDGAVVWEWGCWGGANQQWQFVAPANAGGPTVTWVQGNYATPQTNQTNVTVPFTAAQNAGDLNVVVVGWNDSSATIQTITDSQGNTYALAAGPTVQTGIASQSIYYANNTAAAGAGANVVSVTFTSPAAYADIRILEYTGADLTDPVDVAAASSGNSATSSSGSATTTNATDLIFGANLVQTLTSGPGNGFSQRLLTSPDGDIAEDQLTTVAGSHSVSAPLSSPGPWIMQMVAFRARSNTGTSASGPHTVTLTWNASVSSNVVSYNVYRATGTSSSYTQLATDIVNLTYIDRNVVDGTAYTYTVTSVDNNGNESAYSSTAAATIPST